MIIGAHALIYSKNAEADRAFLRDVFRLPHVDAGEGWLIFGLPPAELGVHPGEANDRHELNLMCSDIEEFVAEMALRGVTTSPIENAGWGIITHVQLPGGGRLGVYQPRHSRPAATAPVAPSRVKNAKLPRRAATDKTRGKGKTSKATSKRKAAPKKVATPKRRPKVRAAAKR